MQLNEEKISFKKLYNSLKDIDNKSEKFSQVLNVVLDLYQLERQGRPGNKLFYKLSKGKLGVQSEPKKTLQALKITIKRLKDLKNIGTEISKIFKEESNNGPTNTTKLS